MYSWVPSASQLQSQIRDLTSLSKAQHAVRQAVKAVMGPGNTTENPTSKRDTYKIQLEALASKN